VLTFGLLSFKGDKDALNKKVFTLQVNEIKEGQAKNKKPLEDELEFKDGKVFSNILYDKHQFKWIKYTVTKDSTYEEEGEQKHLIDAMASTTNEANELVEINVKVDGFDIEGSYKLLKKDVVKKLYEYTGKEKAKKK